jgi:flagellar motor switch protein FliN/FliY
MSDTPETNPATDTAEPQSRARKPAAKPAPAKAAAAPGGEAEAGDAGFGASIPELAERPAETNEAAAPETGTAARPGHTIQSMLNVDLEVKVVLGECRMPISQLLKLTRGSVIDLDQRIGEPVDLVVNDRVVARGDLVKLDGERIGVSLTEIVRDHVSDF